MICRMMLKMFTYVPWNHRRNSHATIMHSYMSSIHQCVTWQIFAYLCCAWEYFCKEDYPELEWLAEILDIFLIFISGDFTEWEPPGPAGWSTSTPSSLSSSVLSSSTLLLAIMLKTSMILWYFSWFKIGLKRNSVQQLWFGSIFTIPTNLIFSLDGEPRFLCLKCNPNK